MHGPSTCVRQQSYELMVGGLIETMPTSVNEAKLMGEDLLEKKGGELLSKASGTCVDIDLSTN